MERNLNRFFSKKRTRVIHMTHSASKPLTQGTRDEILRSLKTRGGVTVLELSEMVGVSAVTVRHHLNSLQADKLVEARAERRSVGRPHHIFFLTDAGEELFPKQYLGLTRRLLDQMKSSLPSETVSRLFEHMAEDIIAKHQHRLRGRSQDERMEILVEILEEEGFMVTWKKEKNTYRIIEHNCPYRNLGNDHPDICTLDQTLITSILEAPIRKTSCLLKGDSSCTYVVQNKGERFD